MLMKNTEGLLTSYWGYKSFKPQQEKIINSIIKGNNTLAILPTGGGKSLCYQLPSLILEGTTLVISPLIALMEEQVGLLKKIGISSFYFKSESLNSSTNQQLDNLINGNYKIVYCSPEKFINKDFLNKISQANINHIAIDEAHCISEWGHEFRPSYRKIRKLLNLFSCATISAFTGSASKLVKNDIIKSLELENFKIIESSFERKNISYKVNHVNDKNKALLKIIQNESSIVYCNTRKTAEIISRLLNKNGYSSDYFHGGVSLTLKKEKLLKWHSEEIKIIIATTAFGMGIDKSNVRFVIHFSMPLSLEGYYQEIGRAGRDGKLSDCIMYYSVKDKVIYEKMLKKEAPKSMKKVEHNNCMLSKLQDITNFFENIIDCKHFLLCKHFGEIVEPQVGFCKLHCDNCVRNRHNITYKDVTLLCRKLVNLVVLLKNDATLCKIKKFIKGSSEMKKYSALSDFGIGRNYSETLIDRVLTYLVKERYIKNTVFRNKFGFYNDKIMLYNKSKELLDTSSKTKDLHIKLPFLKNKNQKEYFIIKKTKMKS